MKKFILLLCLLFSLNSYALESDDNVQVTIKHLKLLTSMYPEKASVDWMIYYMVFLKHKIIDSPQRDKIEDAVCQLRPEYYKECVNSALGFEKTAIGTEDVLNLLLGNCLILPHDPSCSYYQLLLNQNITQLKYILQL
jgi:hypothetical protein